MARDIPDMQKERTHSTNAQREQVANYLQTVVAATVLFPVAIVILSVAGFALGFRLSVWPVWLAALTTLLGLRAVTNSWRDAALPAITFVALHVSAYVIAGAFYDASWDGLAYQQDAVLRLAAGWNPLFQSSAAYGQRYDFWLDHYPKASWIVQAATLLIGGHIEPGKLFNFTLIAASAGQIAVALLRLTTLRNSLVAMVALLAAFNPVAVYQCATFYVDGMLFSLLAIMAAALVDYLFAPRWSALVVALLATCFVINLKFTGLVYAVVFLAMYSLAICYLHGLKSALRLAVPALLAGIVSMLLIGYAPYVQNIREMGNPFYPLSGRGSVDISSETRPVNLANHNRITRFFISNFSRSEPTGRPPGVTRLKFPFWIYSSERAGSIWVQSPEAGGFGPLFGAILVLTAIASVALVSNASNRSRTSGTLLIAGGLAISVFAHGETWWARYVPQAWLVPLVIAVACLLARKHSRIWWLGCIVVAVCALNVLFVGSYSTWYQWKYAQETRRSLHAIATFRQPIIAYLGPFHSLRERLREAGIKARIVQIAPVAEPNRRHQLIPSPSHLAFCSE